MLEPPMDSFWLNNTLGGFDLLQLSLFFAFSHSSAPIATCIKGQREIEGQKPKNHQAGWGLRGGGVQSSKLFFLFFFILFISKFGNPPLIFAFYYLFCFFFLGNYFIGGYLISRLGYTVSPL
jgi:hypothetical protein